MAKASDNKWLIVKPGVVMTPIIEPVIIALDKYFEKHKHKAYVTSGLRDSEDQLRIIRQYLTRTGLNKKYPEAIGGDVDTKMLLNGKAVYRWQPGWSALLNKGVIINPPRPAECLMDYTRDGKNKKGQIIGSSPHAEPGRAFDIGGGSDNIDNEVAILEEALTDRLTGLKGILRERANNCLHVDCQ